MSSEIALVNYVAGQFPSAVLRMYYDLIVGDEVAIQANHDPAADDVWEYAVMLRRNVGKPDEQNIALGVWRDTEREGWQLGLMVNNTELAMIGRVGPGVTTGAIGLGTPGTNGRPPSDLILPKDWPLNLNTCGASAPDGCGQCPLELGHVGPHENWHGRWHGDVWLTRWSE